MVGKGRSYKAWKKRNENTNIFIRAENNSKQSPTELKDKIEKKQNKLEDYKVNIVIKKTMKNPFEKQINYNENYKKIVLARINQSGFTLNGSIVFYDDVNQHEDGSYHTILFNYGLNYPDNDYIVSDVILRIEKYLEEAKDNNI